MTILLRRGVEFDDPFWEKHSDEVCISLRGQAYKHFIRWDRFQPLSAIRRHAYWIQKFEVKALAFEEWLAGRSTDVHQVLNILANVEQLQEKALRIADHASQDLPPEWPQKVGM